jgi:hypothetical protein
MGSLNYDPMLDFTALYPSTPQSHSNSLFPTNPLPYQYAQNLLPSVTSFHSSTTSEGSSPHYPHSGPYSPAGASSTASFLRPVQSNNRVEQTTSIRSTGHTRSTDPRTRSEESLLFNYKILMNEQHRLNLLSDMSKSICNNELLTFLGLSVVIFHEYGVGLVGGKLVQHLAKRGCNLMGPIHQRQSLTEWHIGEVLLQFVSVLVNVETFQVNANTIFNGREICMSFLLLSFRETYFHVVQRVSEGNVIPGIAQNVSCI